eukprot:2227656-Lingulodinium_polyedra.AAC.1
MGLGDTVCIPCRSGYPLPLSRSRRVAGACATEEAELAPATALSGDALSLMLGVDPCMAGA